MLTLVQLKLARREHYWTSGHSSAILKQNALRIPIGQKYAQYTQYYTIIKTKQADCHKIDHEDE